MAGNSAVVASWEPVVHLLNNREAFVREGRLSQNACFSGALIEYLAFIKEWGSKKSLTVDDACESLQNSLLKHVVSFA